MTSKLNCMGNGIINRYGRKYSMLAYILNVEWEVLHVNVTGASVDSMTEPGHFPAVRDNDVRVDYGG